MNKIPRITVGIPVYNGSKTIDSAINSILFQNYKNFEIIISDDASTDGTGEICNRYASADPRIRYIRQESNIGLYANFNFLVNCCKSEYFTWLSQDDLRSCEFLEINTKFLDDNPEYVGATSPNKFIGQMEEELITFSLEGGFNHRIQKFLPNLLSSHAILYSVFRTEMLKGCPYLPDSYLALDWSICLYMISLGSIKRTSGAIIEIGTSGVSNSRNRWKKFRNMKIEYVFPFYRFSLVVISLFRGMDGFSRYCAVICLIRMNFWAFKHQIIEAIVDYKNEQILR